MFRIVALVRTEAVDQLFFVDRYQFSLTWNIAQGITTALVEQILNNTTPKAQTWQLYRGNRNYTALVPFHHPR